MRNFLKTQVRFRSPVFNIRELITAVIVWILLSVIVCTCGSNPDPVFAENMTFEEDISSTTADSVFTYIFLMRLEHPDIVMAQCIEESGNFNSPLFLHGHNCTGMRVPAKRPTLALGIMYNHARFKSWKDCIADYAIWQSIYARGLDRDAYLAYLDRVYAEKKGYSERLKKIIETRGL